MSVERKSLNNCSLQIICLCATGVLFASCISCIAGDNEASTIEPLIEKIFNVTNVNTDTRVEHARGLSSEELPPAQKAKGGFSVLNKSSENNTSALGSIQNNISQINPEPVKTPSLPADPNELPLLLKDAIPVVDHHQPPVGRKGVSLEPNDSETKAEVIPAVSPDVSSVVRTDLTKNKTCTCTIVAAEGSPVEDCHSCNETQASVSSVTTNSPTSQNVNSSTVINATNSVTPTNGTVASEKAVTDPTSVSSANNARNQTEDVQDETHKPAFTIDETEEARRLATSSYPESAFIIPVVATILIVPLLIALVMILYKRGKEFWERRHYRRMDFLIDGMYNE